MTKSADPSPETSPPDRLGALLKGHQQVMEMLSKDLPLKQVLAQLCRLMEAQLPGALCSVLLVEKGDLRMRDGAAPSLPADYVRALDGVPYGPAVGSCGTAIHYRKAVVVEDLTTDPLWAPYKDLALPHGLAACASTPILDGQGEPLGAFAFYHRDPGPFSQEELSLLLDMNHLAALAISHERQAASLREQVDHLRSVQRLANLGFWTWWITENRVEWSEGLYDIYGLDALSFGASFEGYLDRVHPEDRQRVQALIGQALESRTSFSFEERILRPDGGLRWLRSWGDVILDEAGSPERMMGTCHDITDLKEGQHSLLQFQALIENSPDFIAMASMEGRVTYVNPAGLKLVGLESLDKARTCTIRDFLTEEGFKRSQTIEVPAVMSQGHWEGQSTLRHFLEADPIPVQISTFLVKDPERGDPLCFATSQHDITELKKGERELMKFRALIENSPNLVAMSTPEGEVLYMNPAGLKLLGLASLDAARATTISDLMPPDAFRHHHEVKMPAIHATGRWEGESSLLHQTSGERIPVQVASFLVKDPHTGEPLCMATSQYDLRAQKQTEEALRQAQKMESLAVLAGGIAHDFNNLLTAILSNLELTKTCIPKDSEATRYLERMGRGVGRAADLAQQMLAYSGKGKVVVKVLDLNALITDMTELLTAALPKKAQLSLVLGPDLPSVEADMAQIQQVVMNLVINAAESLPESSGHITLSTSLVKSVGSQPGSLFLGSAPSNAPHVKLEISDTGSGMTTDVKARIFDPFFTTKATGRGLGLSAILSILRGHQAAIAVESEVGRGTKFSIFLPASGKSSGPHPALARPAFTPGGLVLVVDDEPEIREAASALLHHLGFTCIQAADGEEAITVATERGKELRLVLLDLSMPRKDGREAFQAIHALHPQLRVILTSGFDMQEAAQGIVGQGLAGFIQKPYRLQALREAVEAALSS